jgi:hypothetical protein
VKIPLLLLFSLFLLVGHGMEEEEEKYVHKSKPITETNVALSPLLGC